MIARPAAVISIVMKWDFDASAIARHLRAAHGAMTADWPARNQFRKAPSLERKSRAAVPLRPDRQAKPPYWLFARDRRRAARQCIARANRRAHATGGHARRA